MRKKYVTGAVVLVMGVVAAGAWGQVVPPAPPKTPPTPEYTPPPPPPPPKPITPGEVANQNAAKPAPEAPLPTLVARDEQGALRPLTMPAEEAAVRALSLDEETMAKVEASLQARRADLDRLVIENVESLAELRAFAAKVNETTPMDDFTKEAKKALAFRNFPGVLDRLSREGAIDPQVRSRAQKVAAEYNKAVDDDMMKDLNHGNTQSMVIVGFRRYLRTTATEAYASLDRQLLESAARAAQILDSVEMPAGVRSEAKARVRSLPAGDGDDAKEKRLEALRGMFFEVLQPEQRQAFLKAANPALFEQAPAK